MLNYQKIKFPKMLPRSGTISEGPDAPLKALAHQIRLKTVLYLCHTSESIKQ